MIWLIIGGIPLAIIVLLGIGVMIAEDAKAFGITVAITGLLIASVLSVIYGLEEVGILK